MDVHSFRRLLTPEGQRLLARIADAAGTPPADEEILPLTTRLRREYSAPLVAAALTQTRLRARARAKFGSQAERMYFTGDGLEQATHAGVAELRARRFGTASERAGSDTCVDLCCGVGGDLVALARAGLHVEGVDRDPLAVEVARANLDSLNLSGHASVRLADVEDVDVAGFGAAFCDPARRNPHARVFRPQAYSPPLSHALELVRSPPGGGIKVAPGIPHEFVPGDAEAEWVSEDGDVKEAALWFGTLAGDRPRRATLLPSGATLADDPDVGDAQVSAPARYLYEPDGAVLRAGLVAQVAARVEGSLLDPSIAYVTSDRHVPTPFATAYEITDAVPFALKRLRALLRDRRVGVVTIKKRGSAVDVERLRRDLRLSGPESLTVVLTRLDGAHYALLCHPLDN